MGTAPSMVRRGSIMNHSVSEMAPEFTVWGRSGRSSSVYASCSSFRNRFTSTTSLPAGGFFCPGLGDVCLSGNEVKHDSVVRKSHRCGLQPDSGTSKRAELILGLTCNLGRHRV